MLDAGTALGLVAGRHDDVNVRGAFLHMLGDAGAAYDVPRDFQTPAELLPLVGRYEKHNPESEPLRVFVRNGRLYAAEGV